MEKNLVVKKNEDNGRYKYIPQYLQSQWKIIPVDFDDNFELKKALKIADAVISMTWSESFPPAPRLKLLQLQGAGTNGVDLFSVPPDSYVCNVYEHEISISEYVLAAMLMWVTDIDKHDNALRNGDWYGSYLFGPPHKELFGQTLGIVGYGRIGREVAVRAKAFGMKIISCNRTAKRAKEINDDIMPMTKLDSLLDESDFVLLSTPLDKTTEKIIKLEQLRCIGENGVIINIARGELIDEEDLYQACKEKIIGGAIIDTWYKYPLSRNDKQAPSDFNFRLLDNVMMTPHSSAWTERLIERRCEAIAHNLDSISFNIIPKNVVREPIGS